MTNVVLLCGADMNSQNDVGNSALLVAIKVLLKGQDFEKKVWLRRFPRQRVNGILFTSRKLT